jgi:hypothetical protein
MNGLRHGLRSEETVVAGERLEDWQQLRDAIGDSIKPADALESALAERVAFALWRLGRAARYEAGQIGMRIIRDLPEDDRLRRQAMWATGRHPGGMGGPDPADPEDISFHLDREKTALTVLAGLDDDPSTSLPGRAVCDALYTLHDRFFHDEPFPADLFIQLGLPAEFDYEDGEHDWTGWTRGHVRRGIELLCAGSGLTPTLAVKWATESLAIGIKHKQELLRTALELQRLDQQVRCLPKAETCELLMRYETFLTRQLNTSLQTLAAFRGVSLGKTHARQ